MSISVPYQFVLLKWRGTMIATMPARVSGVLTLLCALGAGTILSAQSVPDLSFGGHNLGEPADVFFATARTMQSKELTKEYCKSLLNDPNVRKTIQSANDAAAAGGPVVVEKKNFAVLDVSGCKQISAALNGEQASVGARLASEIGKGSALFAHGRLNALSLEVEASCDGTVSDMEKRFGFSGTKGWVARPGWPVLQETRWEKNGILAAVWQEKYLNWCNSVIGILEPPYDSYLRGTPAAAPPAGSPPGQPSEASPSVTNRVHVSAGVMQGLLFHRAQPVYPEPAKQAHIEGVVVLRVIIGRDGHVIDLGAISGPADLMPAAMDAVRQWEYKPYLLAGEATEVETQVRINFALAH
jgi:TonB family protein